jgi:hypothetical protein
MQKTIIFGAFAALLGLAAVAQANDQKQWGLPDGTQVTSPDTSAAARDSRGGKHDREARNERSREHEAGERRHKTREDHDADEGAEHKRRR